MYWDINEIPPEYRRRKIYATYHRIYYLLCGYGRKTPQIGEEEINNMKFHRKNGFSYHDIAYISRRSSASVHASLRDLILDEIVTKL